MRVIVSPGARGRAGSPCGSSGLRRSEVVRDGGHRSLRSPAWRPCWSGFWGGLMWSGSGAGIGPELTETFLNSSRWSRRDLRISCLSCSARCLGVKGSQVQILSSRRRDGRFPHDEGAAHRCLYLRKRCRLLGTGVTSRVEIDDPLRRCGRNVVAPGRATVSTSPGRRTCASSPTCSTCPLTRSSMR